MSCEFHAFTKSSTITSGLAVWAELLTAKPMKRNSGAKTFHIDRGMWSPPSFAPVREGRPASKPGFPFLKAERAPLYTDSLTCDSSFQANKTPPESGDAVFA